MKPTRTLLAALCGLLCFLSVACSQSSEAPPLKDVQFKGDEPIGDKVENFKGTAFLDIQEDVARLGGGEGVSYFVLLSPTDPMKGILVRTRLSNQELEKLQSGQLDVTGRVTTVDDGELVRHFQERYNLTLRTGADGKPLLIEHDGEVMLPKASAATPEAGATLNLTPETIGTPPDEPAGSEAGSAPAGSDAPSTGPAPTAGSDAPDGPASESAPPPGSETAPPAGSSQPAGGASEAGS